MSSCFCVPRQRSAFFQVIIVFLVALFPLFDAVASAQQRQSPIGWWTFSEGSGATAADSSGNNRTALLWNGIRWMTSTRNAAATSASAHQYISIPLIDLTGTKAVTVALWVNRNYGSSGDAVLLESTFDYRRSTTGFSILADSTVCAGLEASLRGDAGYTSNCYSRPSSGVWHHIAAVFDKSRTAGDQVAFYVDGALQTPNWSLSSAANTNNFGKDPLLVMARGGISNFASGEVSDLRIYNSALDAGKIQNIYQENSVGLSPSFWLSVDPFCITGVPGSTVFSTVTTTITGGFNSDVTLSVSGVPDGTTVSFNPDPVPAPGAGTSTMVVSVGPNTATGFYKMTVLGASGGMQRFKVVTLTVISAENVTLTWDASKSQVIGYNAYRSLTTGGPYMKLNSGLIPVTTFTDMAVKSGYTYYYVTTAVDSEQQESGYSNEAYATVP